MLRNVSRLLLPAFALLLMLGLLFRRGINRLPVIKRRVPFRRISDLVIQYLEGGYSTAEMLKDGRLKPIEDPEIRAAYERSGETLYGIDRRWFKVNDPRVIKFWAKVDQSGIKKFLGWNKFPAEPLNSELRAMVADFMEDHYKILAKKYLTEKAREIVENYPPLYANFVYAAWNGPGFFERFGKLANANTDKSPADIYDLVQAARMKSVKIIRNGVPKLDKIAKILLNEKAA